MLVCHCFQLTDRDVRTMALEGELPCFGGKGRAGSACGGCLPVVQEIEAETAHPGETAETSPVLSGRSTSRIGQTQSVA